MMKLNAKKKKKKKKNSFDKYTGFCLSHFLTFANIQESLISASLRAFIEHFQYFADM